MKITIYLELKTITVEEDITLTDLFNKLKQYIPEHEWNDFRVVKKVEYVGYPYTPTCPQIPLNPTYPTCPTQPYWYAPGTCITPSTYTNANGRT